MDQKHINPGSVLVFTTDLKRDQEMQRSNKECSNGRYNRNQTQRDTQCHQNQYQGWQKNDTIQQDQSMYSSSTTNILKANRAKQKKQSKIIKNGGLTTSFNLLYCLSDNLRMYEKSYRNEAKEWKKIDSTEGTFHSGGGGVMTADVIEKKLQTNFKQFEKKDKFPNIATTNQLLQFEQIIKNKISLPSISYTKITSHQTNINQKDAQKQKNLIQIRQNIFQRNKKIPQKRSNNYHNQNESSIQKHQQHKNTLSLLAPMKSEKNLKNSNSNKDLKIMIEKSKNLLMNKEQFLERQKKYLSSNKENTKLIQKRRNPKQAKVLIENVPFKNSIFPCSKKRGKSIAVFKYSNRESKNQDAKKEQPQGRIDTIMMRLQNLNNEKEFGDQNFFSSNHAGSKGGTKVVKNTCLRN